MVYAMGSIGVLGFIVWARLGSRNSKIIRILNSAICWNRRWLRNNTQLKFLVTISLQRIGPLVLLRRIVENLKNKTAKFCNNFKCAVICPISRKLIVIYKEKQQIYIRLLRDLDAELLNYYTKNIKIFISYNIPFVLCTFRASIQDIYKCATQLFFEVAPQNEELSKNYTLHFEGESWLDPLIVGLSFSLTFFILQSFVDKGIKLGNTDSSSPSLTVQSVGHRPSPEGVDQIRIEMKKTSSTSISGATPKDSINVYKPQHKKSYNSQFLDWFVGFSEGDGSFIVNSKTKQPLFIITQKDPKILYKIRTNLGFGRVIKRKDGNFQYRVSNRQDSLILKEIFKNRIILNKVLKRFINWQYYLVTTDKTTISLNQIKPDVPGFRYESQEPGVPGFRQELEKEWGNKLRLDNAWLSGFIDAEGCFTFCKRSGRKKYRPRFTLVQKNAKNTFDKLPFIWLLPKTELIREEWSSKIKMGYNRTNKENISTFTMDSFKSLTCLLDYLKKYPLKSNKNINYHKWLKLYQILLDGGRGKDFETIKLMAESINNKKIK